MARPGPPAGLTGVGQEQHRSYDAVAQRVAVAVDVVRRRPHHAVAAAGVGDERDRVGVGPERRAGQRQPPGRRLERLADGVAPAERVAAVVDLVEDHQRAPGRGPHPVQRRVGGDLRVGQHDPAVVPARGAVGVLEVRVQRDAGDVGGGSPLGLEVLGRRHHRHGVDLAGRDQLGGDPQRERGLAGAGRRDGQKVLRTATAVGLERGDLPGTERTGGDGHGPARARTEGRCRGGAGGRGQGLRSHEAAGISSVRVRSGE